VAAPPNPGGTAQFGPTTTVAPTRSWLVIADGKLAFGPVTLSYMLPFGNIYTARTVTGAIAAPGSQFNIYYLWAVLEYKDHFLGDKLQATARAYYSQFERTFNFQVYAPSVVAPPITNPDGTTNIGGLQLNSSSVGQRIGGTLDLDGQLPYHLRLLGGGEAFYEGLSGSNSQIPSPVASALPLLCPLAADGSRVSNCPLNFIDNASRIVGAVYGDLQWRLPLGLVLDGGVRLQKGFGQRPYDLTPLYSATLVWNFFRSYYFKANYATGFRPPTFQYTDAARGSLNWLGNPSLKNETSQAFQGELNGRLLRDVAYVRELELRIDYSYTVLDNLILREGQQFANSGTRAIQSVEAFARLYLHGDHFLQAAYTYLDSYSSQAAMRGMPNHWFSLSAVVNVIKSHFDLNATLTVLGPFEDPKRYPSGPGSIPGATSSENLTAITFDPAPAVALLQLGARVRLVGDQLVGSVQLYNVLDQHYYLPNPVYDLVPQTPANLIAAPGFSFFASLAYHPRF
jgi:outer membrane receptor protein involved in Fe transport